MAAAPSGLGSAEQLVDDAVSATALGIAADELPARARVVVVGGGIIGVSVALHLARAGWTDTLLLERDRISSGTTWHPAGLLAGIRASHALTDIATYSTEAYARVEDESGIAAGFNRRGCLTLARTTERMTELRYTADMALHHGIEAHVLSRGEIADQHPMLDVTGVVGGVLAPADGTVNPGGATAGFAKLAAEAGVRIVEGTALTGIDSEGGIVRSVRVGEQDVECEVVVLCTGLWTWELARALGVPVALHAAEHMWVMSPPVSEPVEDLPYLRDLDGHFYVRGYRDRLIVGAFEPDGKPRPPASIPGDFSFGEFEPDREHFALPLGKARERVPELRDLEPERWLNAPETFTPDAQPLLGESAEIAGLFVAAGMNSQGILLGPGIGRAIAEWVVAGSPQFDSAPYDVRRFASEQTTLPYLGERTRETLGRLYAMHWPQLQPETARETRLTPLHARTEALGACFGELGGWERPNWYGDEGWRPEQTYGWERQPWFDRVAAEHRAAREAVAIFDLSSFGKTLVSGPGAKPLVQSVFASDLDTEVGRVTYTTMLNSGGGVEVDLTVTRLGPEEFLVVAPTITQRAVFGVLQWLGGRTGAVTVTDVTSAYATIAVMGPRSRELLARLSFDPLDNESFPYQHARTVTVGAATMTALRVSFVGELGWELYAPADGAVALLDALRREGADLGLRPAGYFALDSLRMEKGYRHWGADIGPADTPREAGIGFTVDWEKPSFIGRAALEPRRQEPLARRLVHLLLEDPEPLLYHGEPVLLDGEPIGKVTSGAYAHTLGAAAAMAMVERRGEAPIDREMLAAGGFEVLVAGERVPARAQLAPLYDPKGERLRM